MQPTPQALSRSDTSVFGRWWWTVDHWLLGAVAILIVVGLFLVHAAGPAVSMRLGLDSTHYVVRHVLLLLPAIGLLIATSLVPLARLKLLAALVLGLGFFLMLLTLQSGLSVKGAQRWLYLGGLSLQPSEFVKPAFAVVGAWLMARKAEQPQFPGNLSAFGLLAVIVGLLLLQPDLGMSIVMILIWGAMYLLNGMPLLLFLVLLGGGIAAGFGAYYLFPHAQSRIDRFLNPDAGDNYQVQRSLEAFMNGGWTGTGPGQGTVKMTIPDAHTDFIFAVMGEEWGFFWCLALLAIYAFILLRGFQRLKGEKNLFILLATAGLLTQFGLQAFINMGSTLHLLPTKGMTLPFVSYGGSSLWAVAFGMGLILALTRRRYGPKEP